MCKRSFGGRSLPIHQKTPIYSFFAHLRLADTELAATRSHRQIEALALVFCCIQKTYPGRCGKGHFEVTLYPHLGEKKTNFDHFRKAILADSVTVRTR